MKSLKIRQLLETIDHDQIRTDLTKLVDLWDNPIFLKGIGENANECPPVSDFKVIRDYGTAQYRMTDQSVWDLPEPLPYQYFVDIVESECGRLKYRTISTQVKKQIDQYCERFISPIRLYYYEKIDFLVKRFNIKGIINDQDIYESILNSIEGDLGYLIQFCKYGGFAASPILCRFYEAFLTGGAPCSWVGPLPEKGGDPKDCLQILYRGPVADPKLIVG